MVGDGHKLKFGDGVAPPNQAVLSLVALTLETTGAGARSTDGAPTEQLLGRPVDRDVNLLAGHHVFPAQVEVFMARRIAVQE
ncbi:MAG: hypothetical protein JNL29_14510 [Nitrospira sp.]|nr:hypothetical protein [Nitrospira sp.]MBS0167409.1 hypothetical protein [Nitrospira sp.]